MADDDAQRRARPIIPEHTGVFKLHLQAQATLNTESLQMAVKLPIGVDVNDWIAAQVLGTYDEVTSIVSLMEEFCTHETCPKMQCGKHFLYSWPNEVTGKSEKVPAPEYMKRVVDFGYSKLNDPEVIPVDGSPVPHKTRSVMSTLLKRMFRVYAHLYINHFSVIQDLNLEAHVNCCFKHFLFFVLEFDLVPRQDMEPLKSLIAQFVKQAAERAVAMTEDPGSETEVDVCPVKVGRCPARTKPRGEDRASHLCEPIPPKCKARQAMTPQEEDRVSPRVEPIPDGHPSKPGAREEDRAPPCCEPTPDRRPSRPRAQKEDHAPPCGEHIPDRRPSRPRAQVEDHAPPCNERAHDRRPSRPRAQKEDHAPPCCEPIPDRRPSKTRAREENRASPCREPTPDLRPSKTRASERQPSERRAGDRRPSKPRAQVEDHASPRRETNPDRRPSKPRAREEDRASPHCEPIPDRRPSKPRAQEEDGASPCCEPIPDRCPSKPKASDGRPSERRACDSRPSEHRVSNSRPSEQRSSDKRQSECRASDSRPSEPRVSDSRPSKTRASDKLSAIRIRVVDPVQ